MLKMVIVVPENITETEELHNFIRMLEKEGIPHIEEQAETFLQAEREILEEKEDRRKYTAGYETLVISDSPQVCRRAVQNKFSCVAYLQKEKEYENVRYAIESFEGVDRKYLERICLRYAGLPWEILKTERCIVREMTVEDVEAFYEIYREPSITAYMENLFEDKKEEIRYVKGYIENIYAFYEYGLWTVLDKASGRVIGRAGISWREDTETVELGYVIAKPFQSKGIGFEVCQTILHYVKEELGIVEVCAYIKGENIPSKALIKKLGFTFEKRILLGGVDHEKWTKGREEKEQINGEKILCG